MPRELPTRLARQRIVTPSERVPAARVRSTPRGRLAEQERRRQIQIAKEIKERKIHNAKIDPENADPKIKAEVLKEAKTSIQNKIKSLEDKIERYRQKERRAKRKGQDERADDYDDKQDEYRAELREYQRALRADPNTLIKKYYSGETKSVADYRRQIERASNREKEQLRRAKARAEKQLKEAQKASAGSFISQGILFDKTGNVVTDAKGYAITDKSAKASKGLDFINKMEVRKYEARKTQAIKNLQASKLDVITKNGNVDSFYSPITNKTYKYNEAGVNSYNNEMAKRNLFWTFRKFMGIPESKIYPEKYTKKEIIEAVKKEDIPKEISTKYAKNLSEGARWFEAKKITATARINALDKQINKAKQDKDLQKLTNLTKEKQELKNKRFSYVAGQRIFETLDGVRMLPAIAKDIKENPLYVLPLSIALINGIKRDWADTVYLVRTSPSEAIAKVGTDFLTFRIVGKGLKVTGKANFRLKKILSHKFKLAGKKVVKIKIPKRLLSHKGKEFYLVKKIKKIKVKKKPKKVLTKKELLKQQSIQKLRQRKAEALKNDARRIKAGEGERTYRSIGRNVDDILTATERSKLVDIYSKYAKITKQEALRKLREMSMYQQKVRLKSDVPSIDAAIAFKRTGKSVTPKSFLEFKRYGITITERVGNRVKVVALEFDLRGKKAINIGLKVATGKGKVVGVAIYKKAIKRVAVDVPEFRLKDVFVAKVRSAKTGKYKKNPTIETQLSNIEIRKATFGKKVLGKNERITLQKIFNSYKGEARLKKINNNLQKIWKRLGKEAEAMRTQVLRIDRKGTYRIGKKGTLIKEADVFIEISKGKGNLPTKIGILKKAFRQQKGKTPVMTRVTHKGKSLTSKAQSTIKIRETKLATKTVAQRAMNDKIKILAKQKTKVQQQKYVNRQIELETRRIQQVVKSIYTGQPKQIRIKKLPTQVVGYNIAVKTLTSLIAKSTPTMAVMLRKALRELKAVKTIQSTQLKQLNKTLLNLKQLQKLKGVLRTKTITITPRGTPMIVPTTVGIPKPRVKPVKPLKKKKMVYPRLPKGFAMKTLSRKQPTYKIVVKVRGKPIAKLPREMTKRDARDFLAYEIDHTLARSAWIEPTGQSKRVARIPKKMVGYYSKTARKLRPYKIRKGKKKQLMDAYIEKAKYFQDTKLEKAQVKRIKAKKKVIRRPAKRKVVKKKTTTKGRVAKKRPVRRKVVKRKPVRKKVTRRAAPKRRKRKAPIKKRK